MDTDRETVIRFDGTEDRETREAKHHAWMDQYRAKLAKQRLDSMSGREVLDEADRRAAERIRNQWRGGTQ